MIRKGRHKWAIWKRHLKPLPKPKRKEQIRIKTSLGLDADHPFPKCPGKGSRHDPKRDPFIKAFEKKGDYSHSGTRRQHICHVCQCKRTAGWGTTHYGVGYCYWHDVQRGMSIAKTMTIAIQQGYPLDPVKYHSDREYIDEVRKQAEAAQGRLSLAEELHVLRAHIQEIEKLYNETGADQLTMKTAKGAERMTDDVKVTLLVKLITAVSLLTRDTYTIDEKDYCHIDEIKQWLWRIYKMVEDKYNRMMTGEIKPEQLLIAMQGGLKEIPLPETGRKKK